uniref:Uncharacterized protein n=1 Tax=Oryza brachyantha TaxID=4533 RepID=J3LSA0_ORYBR
PTTAQNRVPLQSRTPRGGTEPQRGLRRRAKKKKKNSGCSCRPPHWFSPTHIQIRKLPPDP